MFPTTSLQHNVGKHMNTNKKTKKGRESEKFKVLQIETFHFSFWIKETFCYHSPFPQIVTPCITACPSKILN